MRILVLTLLLSLITLTGWGGELSLVNGLKSVQVYEILQNINVCPICHMKNYIVIENTPTNLIGIRCTNPNHYPVFLVMACGITYEESIKNWNMRGAHK